MPLQTFLQRSFLAPFNNAWFTLIARTYLFHYYEMRETLRLRQLISFQYLLSVSDFQVLDLSRQSYVT